MAVIQSPNLGQKPESGSASVVQASSSTFAVADSATKASVDAVTAKLTSTPATSTKQDAIIAKLIAAPATEAKQDSALTSLASILAKMIAAPATEAKQDAFSAKLPAALGATTSALSLSVVQASDDLLRLRQLALRTRVFAALTTLGDSTVIAAPAAGQRIVITTLRVQTTTATAVIALCKAGASDSNPSSVVCGPAIGSGLSENYEQGNEIRFPAATALVVNLSVATSVYVHVRYYLETVATGAPV